jgi:hypothetical protein
MGMTNAERQRLWRRRHAVAEAKQPIKQVKLAQPTQYRSEDNYRPPNGGDEGVSTTPGYSTPVWLHDEQRSDSLGDSYGDSVEDAEVSKLSEGVAPSKSVASAGRSPAKREKDALRYLALCLDNPTVFCRTIDTLPDSSIRRICDAVLNATKGDAKYKLTPAQRTMCNKYKRSIDILVSPKESLATKRRLLRSAKKQVGGSVFVPMMLQASLDTLGNALIPPTYH